MTDNELREGMKPSDRAKRIESNGFLAVFFLGVLVVCTVLLLGLQRVGLEVLYRLSPTFYEGLPPLVFLSTLLAWLGTAFVIMLGAWCSFVWLLGRRRRACKKEWDRRYPLGIDVRNAEIVLANGEADWILILSARFLPIGRMLCIRVDLKEDDAHSGLVQWRQFEDGETESSKLTGREEESLYALVRKLQQALNNGENVMGEPAFVFDGCPCHLQVLGRVPQPMLTYNLNMAGYQGKDDLAVVPEICQRLLCLKEALR